MQSFIVKEIEPSTASNKPTKIKTDDGSTLFGHDPGLKNLKVGSKFKADFKLNKGYNNITKWEIEEDSAETVSAAGTPLDNREWFSVFARATGINAAARLAAAGVIKPVEVLTRAGIYTNYIIGKTGKDIVADAIPPDSSVSSEEAWDKLESGSTKKKRREPGEVTTSDELYQVCKIDFKMDPVNVHKELNVSNKTELDALPGTPYEHYLNIFSVYSGE